MGGDGLPACCIAGVPSNRPRTPSFPWRHRPGKQCGCTLQLTRSRCTLCFSTPDPNFPCGKAMSMPVIKVQAVGRCRLPTTFHHPAIRHPRPWQTGSNELTNQGHLSPTDWDLCCVRPLMLALEVLRGKTPEARTRWGKVNSPTSLDCPGLAPRCSPESPPGVAAELKGVQKKQGALPASRDASTTPTPIDIDISHAVRYGYLLKAIRNLAASWAHKYCFTGF